MTGKLAGATARGWHLALAKPWVSGGVVVIVAAAVVTAVVLSGGSDQSATGATVTTRLVSVSTGTVSQSVATTGTLSPADEEAVSFGSAARITAVKVAQGDTVTKGQVLGTIDTVGLKADLAQAEATLATAESNLTNAQDDSSTSDAQLAADQASVTSAKSDVTDAQTALADATLRSPIAGTVAEVNVTAGSQSSGSGSSSTASSGSGSGGSGSGGSATGGSGTGSSSRSGAGSSTSGGSGSTSTSTSSSSGDFVILGGKQWTISASVDDTEVGLLAKGDQAQITTDNVSGTVFGTVSSIAVLSSSSSGSASYPVTIAVTGSPAGLHDGASATVSIVYKQVANATTVPTAAVHTANGASYVLLDKNGKQTRTTVTIGLSSGGTTQIKSGLAAGEQVYESVITRTGGTGTGATTGTNGTNRRGGFGGGEGTGGGNFPVGAAGGGNYPGGAAGGNVPGAATGGGFGGSTGGGRP